MHTHRLTVTQCFPLTASCLYLTVACETGVAGVCSTGVSVGGTGTEAGPGAEAGTKLDKRVKGDVGRHSVRFIAGR